MVYGGPQPNLPNRPREDGPGVTDPGKRSTSHLDSVVCQTAFKLGFAKACLQCDDQGYSLRPCLVLGLYIEGEDHELHHCHEADY